MKHLDEINRINYANTKHHREQIRNQISPSLINRFELSQNPSLTYKNAFKAVYHDELQKTIEEQREKRSIEKSVYIGSTIPRNNAQFLQNPICGEPMNRNSYSLQKMKKPFIDFQEEKAKKYNMLAQRQLNEGHSFFRSQDEYQQRRQEEQRAAKFILQNQLQDRERLKRQGVQDYQKENYELKENRRRQFQMEILQKEKQKEAYLDLGQTIRQQMEHERVRKHHKSIAHLGFGYKHNPITNPIEYHIQNPYILNQIQRRENFEDSKE